MQDNHKYSAVDWPKVEEYVNLNNDQAKQQEFFMKIEAEMIQR